MWHAIVRLRLYPREIEADLAFKGFDIGWWHRLTTDGEGFPKLSSRKLLVLLDGLGEDSRYRTEFDRAGNWPTWMQMLQTVANEVSLHRASLYAGGDHAYDVKTFISPAEQREQIEEALAEQEFRQEATTKLYQDLGWT